MKKALTIPDNHPLKTLFRSLTERGLAQAQLRDRDILLYLADLLVEFTFVENMYGLGNAEDQRLERLVDMLDRALETEMPDKKEYYKHIGDYSLFMLGMFPEFLVRHRSPLSPAYYADTGRIGYQTAGRLESDGWHIMVFRKLADKFEHCVISLNCVREYTSDPFYQFMFREFGLT